MRDFYLSNGIKLIIFFIFLFCINSFSATIAFQKSISLSQTKEMLANPTSFFVLKKGDIYVIDSKVANIKIFDKKGQLTKIFGRKGLGPDEFVKPYFSAYKNGLVAIEDFGRKTYFVYKIDKDKGLKILKKCSNHLMSPDFQFIDSKTFLISGSKMGKDGKWQLPYLYNFVNDKYKYIIPIEVVYGYKSYKEYYYAIKNTLNYIQDDTLCDVNDEFIFLVMIANLRIVRLDRRSGEVFTFGSKTKNYIKPFENAEIRKAYREQNRKKIIKHMNKMSIIRDIFVLNSGKLGLIYIGPTEGSTDLAVFLQLYNKQGGLINEFKILNSKVTELYNLLYYFEKNNNLIYILEPKSLENFEQEFFVNKVEIIE